MASSLFHLEPLIIFYFLPLFFRNKRNPAPKQIDAGKRKAKEALDAGGYKSGDEPGKTPENPAQLSAKGG